MRLEEAKQILTENGFLIEGSMSLEDKIANAKKFNAPTGECIIMIYDYVNNFDFDPYKGFVGEDEFVETVKEAKVFDLNDMESIKADVKDCLKYAIMDNLDNLQSEVYIVPIKNGKPDFKAKQRMDV